MKRNYFAGILALGVGAMLLISNASGPAGAGNGDRTGSPVNNSTCRACHGGNTAAPLISINITDAGGGLLTSYVPGTTYTVSVALVGNMASPRYGFQATALKSGNTMAGSFASPSSNAQITTTGGRSYAEHNARSTSGTFTFQWTAPAAGSGTVTFYAAGMEANNNGGDSGDGVATTTKVLTEGSAVGVRETQTSIQDLKLFPMPATDRLTLQAQVAQRGGYTVEVVDAQGRSVWNQSFQWESNGLQQVQIPVADWASGMYGVRIVDEKGQLHASSPLLKY